MDIKKELRTRRSLENRRVISEFLGTVDRRIADRRASTNQSIDAWLHRFHAARSEKF